MTAPESKNGVSAESLIRYVLGDASGYMVTWTKVPGTPAGEGIKQNSWRYPEALQEAITHAHDESAMGHDAYYGVSLFKKDGTRRAEDALDLIDRLWMDSDSYKGRRPEGFPDPTAYAISSPGSYHLYWKLTYPIPKERAVELNRRLALWAGMDKHLAAITTILRVPGTINYKRDDPHEVTAEITGIEPWDPDELEALLPPEPKPEPREAYDGPEDAGFALEDWLERHPEAKDAIHGERRDGQSRVKYEVTCPWIEEHTTGDNGSYVGQYPDGALWFKCNHGHGDGLRWKDYRRFYESVDDEGYGEVLVDEDLEDIHETVPSLPPSSGVSQLPSSTVSDSIPDDGPRARAQGGIFPVEVLPPVLRQMTEEVVREMNVPPDYFVAPALATLASAIGGTRYLNVNYPGSWNVLGNLSAATVADSADKKTPPWRAATAPAENLQKKNFEKWKLREANYEEKHRRWEVEKKHTPKGEVPPAPPEKPKLEYVLANEFTSEVLAEILNNSHPKGVLITDDELAGLFMGMDQYKAGKGNERQRHLKIMANTSFLVSRVSKDPILVSDPVASYTGNIQPDVLPAMLIPRPGGRKGDADDGMLHRWLFAFPPSTDVIDSLDEQRAVSSGAKLQYEFLYKKLRELETDEDGNPRRVLFTPDARKKFDEEVYQGWQKRRLRPGLPRLLKSSYGKMADHTARIALVLALCRNLEEDTGEDTGEIITVQDVESATAIAEYFAFQMQKVQNVIRREKEGKEERTLRVLNSLLDVHGDRWKVATAKLHTLLLEGGAYDIPERTTDLTKWLMELVKRTPRLSIEDNKRVGAENARGMEIVRDIRHAPSVPEISSLTVHDGSYDGIGDTPDDTPENGAGGLNTKELVLFALDRLGNAYPKDLARETGRRLGTVKNALTALHAERKIEYTGDENEDGAKEIRLMPPMSSTWDRFTNPTGRADDD